MSCCFTFSPFIDSATGAVRYISDQQLSPTCCNIICDAVALGSSGAVRMVGCNTEEPCRFLAFPYVDTATGAVKYTTSAEAMVCCMIRATAFKVWDPEQAGCPCDKPEEYFIEVPCLKTENIIRFTPTDPDGNPDPNPGPGEGTEGCYPWDNPFYNEVVVEVPAWITCGGETYYFHHWWLGNNLCLLSDIGGDDCVRNPEWDWQPLLPLTDPPQYGCSFDRAVKIRLCDGSEEECDVRICAHFVKYPPVCTCTCQCFSCYISGQTGAGCDAGIPGADQCVQTYCEEFPCPEPRP